uniref:RUN domain-containing protein n=1 Tax=Meloidogyne hapla TaxID=6305 RepID=A0A1I8B6W6_MELHA
MTEIKTDIGFARAFVRIALERKLLYQYLKKLLSNTQLLQKLYKRYSFLRCDDEREQFLFHLLSLNAVDFSCGLDRFPDSFVYIVLTGSLGYTSQISLPANNTQFTFDYKNLGILSTLRVGHKISSERSNHRPIKWCGRWFGRGIDDGALERLLVAEAIVLHPVDEDQEEGNDSNSVNCSESPLSNAFLSPRKTNKYYDNSDNSSFQLQNHQRARSRLRSPSSERRLFGITDNSSESSSGRVMDETLALDTLQSLEHKAGMAVNALMKHFLTISECGQQQQYIGNNSKLSLLLCSDDGGLLSCFNEIFSHGLIQKFFQKIYPWDYVEKVFVWFGEFFRNGEAKKLTREQRSLIIYAYKMVEKIAAHSIVGKEGRFNLFMLLCLRDHIFSGLIPLIIWTPITTQFYEQSAFIRHSSKVSYLVKLVGSLNEFQFDYEQSLTHGLVF